MEMVDNNVRDGGLLSLRGDGGVVIDVSLGLCCDVQKVLVEGQSFSRKDISHASGSLSHRIFLGPKFVERQLNFNWIQRPVW